MRAALVAAGLLLVVPASAQTVDERLRHAWRAMARMAFRLFRRCRRLEGCQSITYSRNSICFERISGRPIR